MIELRFPDGPPPIHPNGVTQNGNGFRRRSSDKDDKHHFHDPDPLIEEILNEDYEQEMASSCSIDDVCSTPLYPGYNCEEMFVQAEASFRESFPQKRTNVAAGTEHW
ncbi:hypothetical protein ANCCAN_07860 [Ancylostoma caninum]|uniref:Uncharacterized protein n=1 Tax=Ancylostoma caninum TaxID=29170 RepID=A0A368GR57_ANCCA|nr:hypothetical protein ANCCAN_07860 [Ancylostoma caninum]